MNGIKVIGQFLAPECVGHKVAFLHAMRKHEVSKALIQLPNCFDGFKTHFFPDIPCPRLREKRILDFFSSFGRRCSLRNHLVQFPMDGMDFAALRKISSKDAACKTRGYGQRGDDPGFHCYLRPDLLSFVIRYMPKKKKPTITRNAPRSPAAANSILPPNSLIVPETPASTFPPANRNSIHKVSKLTPKQPTTPTKANPSIAGAPKLPNTCEGFARCRFRSLTSAVSNTCSSKSLSSLLYTMASSRANFLPCLSRTVEPYPQMSPTKSDSAAKIT